MTVEVRTVNHRFFTPTIKLPGTLARFEGDVREALRRVQDGAETVLVTGSFHTVGDVMETLGLQPV